MVEQPGSLELLFSGEIEELDEDYVVKIPREELSHGSLRTAEQYKFAVFAPGKADTEQSLQRNTRENNNSPSKSNGADRETPSRSPPRHNGNPPVSEGEILDVSIEGIGDKGDGVGKVNNGYVIIVPDTEPGDEVTVRVSEARKNVAFGSVIARSPK